MLNPVISVISRSAQLTNFMGHIFLLLDTSNNIKLDARHYKCWTLLHSFKKVLFFVLEGCYLLIA